MSKPNVIPAQLKINASHLLLIVASSQIGVGLLGFQRLIIKEAGNSAWISSLIIGAYTALTIHIMVLTLRKYPEYNLYQIHRAIFGKMIGFLLDSIYIFYSSVIAFIVLVTFVEVVKTWVFPDISTWVVSSIIMILVAYGLFGGIKSVLGILFISKAFTFWMTLLLIFPIKFANWSHLLPLFQATPMELLKGAYQMTFTVLGFELIYFIYPYFADKENVNKYAQISQIYTTIVYTSVLVVSIVFFSQKQMETIVWGTISFFSVVQFPFIQRFEYIGISIWIAYVIPNIIVYVWVCTKGIKKNLKLKQKYTTLILCALFVIGNSLLESRDLINLVINKIAMASFILVFVYPYILFGLSIIRKKEQI